MKRPLHTILNVLMFTCFLNSSQVFADIWQTNSTNGGGEWSESSTWLNMIDGLPGHPAAGDLIIINGGDMVSISSTVDLSTVHDNKPTSILVNGTLKFWSSPGCFGNSCNVDLLLDSGSEIDVQSFAPAKGIQEEGPEIDKKDIFIGTVSVLPTIEWPFGPGILPMNFALPVDLISFTGIAADYSIFLKWQTGSEEGTKEFVLERSVDGRDDYVEIGLVTANGFSDEIQEYKYEDKNPLSFAYYRLKIIDFDGTYEYSEIIAVEKANHGVSDFEVFPVPIQDEVNIWVNSEKNTKAKLTVSNYLGQVILVEYIELNEGGNKFNFNWENLNSNLHFIIIETDHEHLVKKVF